MKIPPLILILCLFSISLNAAEQAPSLSLSEAASLAEEQIKLKGLSDEHFLRSIQLTENEDGNVVYRAMYVPIERRRVSRGAEKPEPMKLRYIEVSMDSRVSFIEKVIPMESRSVPTRKVLK